jgi:hypothetical protein
MIVRAAICLMTAAACLAGQAVAAPEQGPWTAQDLNAVVDAALVSIDGERDPGTRAMMLAQLAGTLEKTGVTGREQEIFHRAAGYLQMPSTDYSIARTRQSVVAGLARWGNLRDAEVLAAADTAAANQPALLGKLAEGRLGAGDLPYVAATVARIQALPPTPAAPGPVQKTPTEVLGEIGVALAAHGDIAPAGKIAAGLPDLERLEVDREIAHAFCAAGSKIRDPKKGREIAQQSAQLARRALDPAGPAPGQPELAKRALAGAAAFAVAECQGPSEAVAFVNEVSQKSAEPVLDQLFGEAVHRKELDLAAAFDRQADPASAGSLLAAAERRQQRRDNEGALVLAAQASQLALSHHAGDPPPSAQQNADQIQINEELRPIFFELKSLGAYDAALAVVQPIEPGNRRVYFLSLIQAETMKRDDAAVARTLPAATDLFKQPLPGGRYPFELVKALALGGYRDQARASMVEFPPFSPGETALIEAALGNDAALAALNGPKTGLLSDIVAQLAAAGNIEGAKKIVAQFDTGADSARNAAYAAIAIAQIKAGQPRDALATVLKISRPLMQWTPLLRLAAIPPNAAP